VKITVIGAAGGEVTGSAYIVQTKSARVLVDCGLAVVSWLSVKWRSDVLR